MALRTLTVLAAVLALTGAADAQSVATDGDPPPPPPEKVTPETVTPAKPEPPGPAWHFGLGFAGGAESIGDATFGQIGVAFALSRRVVSRLAIGVRGELLTTNRSLDDDAATLIIGRTLRGTVGLEWTAYRSKRVFVPAVVVQGGVGRELTSWDRGTVDRELVYVAVEARSGFDVPKRGPFHGIAWMGTVLSIRLQVAPALPEMAIARACSQCGSARASGHDLGFLVTYGIAFGR